MSSAVSTPSGTSGPFARVLTIARRDLRVRMTYRLAAILQATSGLFAMAALFFVARLVDEAPELGPYQGQYFEFTLLGFVVLSFVTVAVTSIQAMLRAEQGAGTLELLLVLPTGTGTHAAGALTLPVLTATGQALLALVVAAVVFGASFAWSALPLALLVLLLTVTSFAAFGLLSAAVIVVTKRGDPIGTLVAQAATLVAGTAFPIEVMPTWLQWLARVFPGYYALRGLRKALLEGAGPADLGVELAVLAGVSAMAIPVSLWFLGRAFRLARRLGTLGTY